MLKQNAEEIVSHFRAVVPANWVVEARNTECRPGKPERYKVVGLSAGLCIVCSPDARFHATIDNGPGIVERVAARSFGDPSFERIEDAFEAIQVRIRDRFARLSKQILCV